MIYPFEINEHSKEYANLHYPSFTTLRNLCKIPRKERIDIVRLYFTEGIPYAFLPNPVLYEKVRAWIGKTLSVHPKTISLTGSGRIGYTINPYKVQGTPFSEKSDLDFIIVNEQLFKLVGEDYFAFVQELDRKLTLHGKIHEMWVNNSLLISKSLQDGYIDQGKIPNWQMLPTVHKLYDVLGHLLLRLGATPNSPKTKDATVRIYKDWESCVERLSLNIYHALK